MAISLQEFEDWAQAQKQVANPTVGTFPGQCVSLVQQYLNQVFGIPYAPRGNAKDFIPPTFTKVGGAPRAGDIVRYGRNYGGGLGHIGLVDDDGKWLDQNGVVALHVGVRAVPFSAWDSVWRPTKAFNVKRPVAPAPSRPGLPSIGQSIKLIPKIVRTTYHAGTSNLAGTINAINDNFVYVVRGYDPKFPGRIIINSASAGGNGVALALFYVGGARIDGWKVV
jgi:hypothetical protein